jgi:hypothetical protein
MGQQQLLLLLLSAVIVGLATVAGIEAFGQGERRATQDALTQRAVSIGFDILAAHREPSQLGGIDLEADPTDDEIAAAAGLSSTGQFGSGIPAEGAGSSATCDIDGDTVDCGSKQTSRGYPSGLVVKVRVDPNAEEKVKVVAVGEDVDHNN